jgi:selenocysteine-specific elongation factor
MAVTVVVGTAGHIDHGKTALLRALTGTDADRLPEERRRGMTIDVGYAWLGLPDGTELDFVDVPGHDRLVGNMLAGAGEVDAALLVIAADDGPRAQTLEHLGLLDALGVRQGVIAVTKADLVGPDRLAEVVAAAGRLVGPTTLAGAPVLGVSSVTGEGTEHLRRALVELRDRVEAGRALAAPPASTRLAIDRVFAVRGRGTVVTGTLRGAPVSRSSVLRVVPGDRDVRIRGIQVHGREVDVAGPGRAAFNLAGIEVADLGRGQELTSDDRVQSSDRLLAALDRAPSDRAHARLHLGTTQVDAVVGRSGRDGLQLPDGRTVATLRLGAPVAAGSGDRLLLRRSSGSLVAGGVVLDVAPPRGPSRRRQSGDRVAALAAAVATGDAARVDQARLDLHGATRGRLAPDVARELEQVALGAARAAPAEGLTLPELRTVLIRSVRRTASLSAVQAQLVSEAAIRALTEHGVLVRDAEQVRLPGRAAPGLDPAVGAAMDRLEAMLRVAAPPPLHEAARVSACPDAGLRELRRQNRIVAISDDLAYAADTYAELVRLSLEMADQAPLTPAALRDATGTSRKYAVAILEDLDRREILRRTPSGHVPGKRR